MIKFSSDLPCSVKDYEFTELDKSFIDLLKSSEINTMVIRSKGKIKDYLSLTDFSGLVLYRDDDRCLAFKMEVDKKGFRIYSEILGFKLPQYPEVILCSDKTIIYADIQKIEDAPEIPDTIDISLIAKCMDKGSLANGYNHYSCWLTPISQSYPEPAEVNMNWVDIEEVSKLLSEAKTENKSLKIDIYEGQGIRKISMAVISYNSLHIYACTWMKMGKPVNLDKFPDLHNHLIPGVDDGSSSLDESKKLLDELEDLGVEEIVLTPHNNEEFQSEDAKKNFEKLRSSTNVKLYLSAENKITEEFIKESWKDKNYMMHPNGFLLAEFSQTEERTDILNKCGYLAVLFDKVIIAHAERYKNLSVQDISDLSSLGMIIQSNIKSIDKESQDRDVYVKLQSMIDRDLVDVIATDTHHEDHIDQMEDHMDIFDTCIIFNNMVI